MIRFEDELGHGHYWYDASDVAKVLMIKDANGKMLGRNKFLQWMRFNGAICKDNNQPTQQWITLGLARFHFTTKRYKQYGMPLWSDKGIAYIQRRVANQVFTLGFEKMRKKNQVMIHEIC